MVRRFSRPFLPPIAFRAKTNSLVPRTGRGEGKARWHAPFEEVLDEARRGAGLRTGPRLLNDRQRGLQAPVAKRRAKRIEREFSWADQVAGLGEFAWGLWRESRRRWLAGEKRVGLWREGSRVVERERVGLYGEFFGVVDRVAEESRDWEARVRTWSDASQRDVHVQARAQCPMPEGLSRSGHAEGRRAQGSRNPLFLFIGFV